MHADANRHNRRHDRIHRFLQHPAHHSEVDKGSNVENFDDEEDELADTEQHKHCYGVDVSHKGDLGDELSNRQANGGCYVQH